jgi:hypothetical protein
MGVVLIVGLYAQTAMLLNSLGIQLDNEFSLDPDLNIASAVAVEDGAGAFLA